MNERQSDMTKVLFLVAACVLVSILTTSCHPQNGDKITPNNQTNVPCSEGAPGNVDDDCPTPSDTFNYNSSNSNTDVITGTPLESPTPTPSPTSPPSSTLPGK